MRHQIPHQGFTNVRVEDHAIADYAIAGESAYLRIVVDSRRETLAFCSCMINRIKFLGIPVFDQDRALAFYTEKLGFRIFTDQQFSETQRWIELSIPGAETGIVLFTPDGQQDRIGTFVNTSWEVDNVEKEYAELSAKGVEFMGPPQSQPWGSFVIMKDSEGNSICLGSKSR